jgi:membrane peptidoglycan carboxypeptidase
MRDLTGWARARYVAWKAFKWGAILGLCVCLLAAVAIYVTYERIDIPTPNKDFQAQTTTVYYSDGKHVIGRFALQNRQSIPLSQMPRSLRNAVISAEDRSFRTNAGIDVKGIIRAAWHNLRSSGSEQGASTITQQYVKVLYLTQERTWTRKIREAFLAVKLQNTLSKNQILAGYLNTIYFGRGAYGAQAAAQAYFAKDAKDLTVRQSAVLAAVLNSPGYLDPANGRAAAAALLARYQYVLEGMVSMGALDPNRAARAEQQLPKFPKVEQINVYGGQRGYLMTLVKQQLQALHFTNEQIEGGGLNVVTTFDFNKEHAAERAIRQIRPKGKSQLHVALASIEPGSGALRAMIGGKNYLDSQINWAVAGGSPGSSFKPYALAAALGQGISLRDYFDGNSPLTLPDGSTVENEGSGSGTSYGSVNLVTATEDSINTAYVDMTLHMHDGPQAIVNSAVAAGIPRSSPGLRPNVGVSLGSATVSPIAMADGYATFAARGEHAPWYAISKVSNASGVQYEHLTRPTPAFRPAVSSNVTYALQQVVKAGTGFRAQALQRPAAGKTGTATNAHGDVSSSWFVGYTPQLSTAVMYVRGNGNQALNGYLSTYFGQDYPTLTWTAYMTRALRGRPVKDFPPPALLGGVSPTYVPPRTTAPARTTTPSSAHTSSSAPPSTTAPPSTSSQPPTTSAPPTTTAPPPTTSAPTSSHPPPSSAPPTSRPPSS